MIVTVYLRTAGFFELMADKILSRSRTPLQLLIFIALSAGLLSALFVNDTICLLYTPIVLAITVQLGVNPMPYLLALATASNIGSVMTVTGNPQNMLIGIYSKIPYLTFLGALFPVAIAGPRHKRGGHLVPVPERDEAWRVLYAACHAGVSGQ